MTRKKRPSKAMGRPSQRTPLPYHEVEQVIQQARSLTAPDFMPKDLHILEPISLALTERTKTLLSHEDYMLWRLLDETRSQDCAPLITVIRVKLNRIKRESADEYNHCRTQIAKIAKCEEMASAATEDAYLEINSSITAIRSAPADTHQHVVANVSDQSRILLDYLVAEHYPVNARGDESRKEWLKHHWPRMFELLMMFPCRCSYSTSYDDFVGPWLQANQRGDTNLRLRSHTIHLILGFLHNSSPQSVRRKLILP